ncbi:hypothetical protein M011DRAFT_468481 [Sporormia fimetaria CBS 119925]|uniref:Uncharacterized protein n=1 Tax=Sporormia fimetaria CBS 119925 TaxID=1340428 RepID=A0A6A6VA39_9PLEO|nr:hypothetical protein M011DRAFT_468481 [Sporormia fimetaria CBS 119925]
MAARTQDGVFREKNSRMVDEDFGKDPPNLGEDSSDEELDDEDDGDDGNSRDEL